MPKRLIIFIVIFVGLLGWSLVMPALQHQQQLQHHPNTALSPMPQGYKAAMRLFQALHPQQPVHLWEHSLMRLPLNHPQTIWCLEPGPGLFFNGQAYQRRMRLLVQHGYHFIYVLHQGSLPTHKANSTTEALKNLNQWYHLHLGLVSARRHTTAGIFQTSSHLLPRAIQQLGYAPFTQQTEDPEKPFNTLWLWNSQTLTGVQTLLTVESDMHPMPLIVEAHIGPGSVTLVSDSLFFQNNNLDRNDNAALAEALQARFAADPVLFEAYSSGFNQNKDWITTLASGPGAPFLATIVLLFVAFCIGVANRPADRQALHYTANEQVFTQEIFITAMARHYLATERWDALYQKLCRAFQAQLPAMYRGKSIDETIARLAQSRLLDVSLETLTALFQPGHLSHSAAFVISSQRLLAVQRKVIRYVTTPSRRPDYVPHAAHVELAERHSGPI